jgi:hypothetical protein
MAAKTVQIYGSRYTAKQIRDAMVDADDIMTAYLKLAEALRQDRGVRLTASEVWAMIEQDDAVGAAVAATIDRSIKR